MVSIYKNASARPPDPLPGLCPWTPLGDCVPQTPRLILQCSPNIFPKFTPRTVQDTTDLKQANHKTSSRSSWSMEKAVRCACVKAKGYNFKFLLN